MMSVKTLIALDVDETLNSRLDHELLCEADDNGGDEALYPEMFKDVLKFCNSSNGGNRSVLNLGMYVNLEMLKAFNDIREEFDADVLGTSSWFSGNRDDRKVAGFLGIPDDKFIGSGDTGGCEGRCRSVAEAVLVGGYERLIVLDDQPFGWDLFGIEKHRPAIDGWKAFTKECQAEARVIQTYPLDHAEITRLLEKFRNGLK